MTRVLTLTQPWASLVICGAKRVETRSWQTDHRGELAIHAAKTLLPGGRAETAVLCQSPPFEQALAEAGYRHVDDVLAERGKVLGVVELLRIEPTAELRGLSEQERAFGDYTPGRWGWLLRWPRRFAAPPEARGMLGLWEAFPMGLPALAPCPECGMQPDRTRHYCKGCSP